ncbi:hypothetical protein EOE67_03475 [Rheinheimera riviphila]|uniref:EF-hand domain-containing protein n=1 Tax=Rheinheimera riviphila TaxID=1834037 RepID=A0A437R3H0_9GAMM|nr:hypothetical protein [Rheinheimera riviphila]RVU41273.1 hypothetical protein EOE67_03475 [Rheinheimera riviphila]
MKTIFTKSLVALALAAAAGNAIAAVVPNPETNYSAQGVAGATSISLAALDVQLKAEYSLNDVITFTFTGGEVVLTGANPTLVGLAGAPDLSAGITLGYLNRTANSVSFRVTAIDQAVVPTTIDGSIRLAGVVLTKASVAASKAVNVTYAAKTIANDVLDAATTNTGKLLVVKEQFSVATTPFDAEVDVNEDRKLFSGVTPRADVLTITPTNNDTYTLAATLVGSTIKYKVTGDFTWVDQDANGTISAPELAQLAVAGGSAITAKALSTDLRTLTFTDTPVAATPVAVTVTANVSAAAPAKSLVTLNPGSYAVEATVAHTAPAGTVVLTKSGGSWTLNGSTVNVPYMVFGTLNTVQYGQIINVTNSSSVAGDIYVDVWGEDGTALVTNLKVGTATANSVTSIAGAVRTAVGAAGLTNGKASLRIVTNAPEDSVTVYSAYVDAGSRERAIVNNDSKVQTK